MKKYLLLLSVVILGLSACKKGGDFTADQAAIDDAKIQAYMSANNITATKDPSGIYYKILKTGTGAYPTATSTIQVGYTGKLLNGTTFEASSSTVLALSGTIKGWQIGMLKINAGTVNAGTYVPGSGGRILLIIPSALAYGTNATGNITANSVITFTIDLIGVSN